jgi:hypothetical protein
MSRNLSPPHPRRIRCHSPRCYLFPHPFLIPASRLHSITTFPKRDDCRSFLNIIFSPQRHSAILWVETVHHSIVSSPTRSPKAHTAVIPRADAAAAATPTTAASATPSSRPGPSSGSAPGSGPRVAGSERCHATAPTTSPFEQWHGGAVSTTTSGTAPTARLTDDKRQWSP